MIDLSKIEIRSKRDFSLDMLHLSAGLVIRSEKMVSRRLAEEPSFVEEIKTALRYDIWHFIYGDLQDQARKAYGELFKVLAHEGWTTDKINVLLEENQKLLDMLKL